MVDSCAEMTEQIGNREGVVDADDGENQEGGEGVVNAVDGKIGRWGGRLRGICSDEEWGGGVRQR